MMRTVDTLQGVVRMTDKQMEAIKKIMNHYGYFMQRDQFVEELSEAITAVQKVKRCAEDDVPVNKLLEAQNNLRGEIADVIIMVTQMYNFLDSSRIDKIIDEKLERQLKRIKEEQDDEEQEDEDVDCE